LSQPGALRDAAVQVHDLAREKGIQRFNHSTVALAEVDVPGESEPQYYASTSGGHTLTSTGRHPSGTRCAGRKYLDYDGAAR
jgi:hypothetical protein